MELRRRSVPSAKRARRRSSTSADVADERPDLLPELLHLISDRLSNEDIAQASLCCKRWALHLRAGIRHTQIVVCQPPDDKLPRAPAVEALAQHSPSLTDLELLLSGRSSYGPTAKVLSTLSSLKSLQHLTFDFVVSETPKKGSWPIFFSDSLQLGKVPALTIKGSPMPPIAITNLLDTLGSHRQHLKQLHILIGQPNPNSRLPLLSPPLWLRPGVNTYVSGISGSQLEQVVRLTGLQELTFSPTGSVLGSNWKQLSKLRALTSLQVNGPLSIVIVPKLAALKKLRKLSISIRLYGGTGGDLKEHCSQLQHVRDVNIGLVAADNLTLGANVLHQEVQGLASSISSNLQGLNVSGFEWSKGTPECLAVLTALTSLELLQVKQPPAGDLAIDLTPLGKLRKIRKFKMEFPDSPELRVRLGVFWEEEQQRRASEGRRSTRRQSQQQQQQQQLREQLLQMDRPTDVSSIPVVWPELQQLHLANFQLMSASKFDLRGLTCLTSLHLHRALPATVFPTQCIWLGNMPRELKDLQVSGCMLLVPKYVPFEDNLTNLSLSDCSCLSTEQVWGGERAITTLLSQLPSLQHLELINSPGSEVDNELLEQVAPALTRLQSLSVVGIGNQRLTHGALLGLTGLRKLRQLRWHVGDVLDMLPDLTSLAKLKGLVALYIPTALHVQMERWGAYAVLDSLPFCDVHVEAV